MIKRVNLTAHGVTFNAKTMLRFKSIRFAAYRIIYRTSIAQRSGYIMRAVSSIITMLALTVFLTPVKTRLTKQRWFHKKRIKRSACAAAQRIKNGNGCRVILVGSDPSNIRQPSVSHQLPCFSNISSISSTDGTGTVQEVLLA